MSNTGFLVFILAVIVTCLFVGLRYIFSKQFRANSQGCFACIGVGVVFLVPLVAIVGVVWIGYLGWNTPRGPRCLGPDGDTRKIAYSRLDCQPPWIYFPPDPDWRP